MGWRLGLLNLGLRLVAKPLLARAEDPLKLRRAFALLARWTLRPPPHTLMINTILRGDDGNIQALWVQCGQVRQDGVILYLHGGGYILGSPKTHSAMLATLCEMTGLRACLPEYRLAPEMPFPAAVDDALRAYRALLDRGYQPQHIVLGGDSAGGGLTLALLQRILQSDLPSPAGAFVFSPWTDLTFSGDSLTANKSNDPLLPGERIEHLRDMYAGGTNPQHPLISPLFGDYTGAPAVFVQVGSTEILLDDAQRLVARLKEQKVAVDFEVWPDTPHVWQMFHGQIPEADKALEKAARFINSVLD